MSLGDTFIVQFNQPEKFGLNAENENKVWFRIPHLEFLDFGNYLTTAQRDVAVNLIQYCSKSRSIPISYPIHTQTNTKAYQINTKAFLKQTRCKPKTLLDTIAKLKENQILADSLREENIREEAVREEESKKKEKKASDADAAKIIFSKEEQAMANQVISLWNKHSPPLRGFYDTKNERRIKDFKTLLSKETLDHILFAVDKVSKSNFCRGDNDKKWVASIDWFLREGTLEKVLEGNYDNVQKGVR